MAKPMAALRDRNKQTPGGLTFFQAETGWRPRPWSSHDSITRELIAHRVGNPYLLRKHKWATEYNAVAFEVDAFNAKLCEAHGWTDFIVQATPEPPKFLPPHIGRSGAAFVGGVKRSAAGIKNVIEWLGSGLKPVAKELSEGRASVCVRCPKNDPDPNFLQRIEAAAAEKIRSLMAVKHDLNISTTHDANLHTCAACDCPMKLKVHRDLKGVLATTSDAVKADLWEECWILSEAKS
jgi:hypothetical protein